MNFKQFTQADENEVIEHAVYKEHTLGYLFKSSGKLMIGVLSAKVLHGGLDWFNGPHHIPTADVDMLRKATKEDFDFFNVSSKGYDLT